MYLVRQANESPPFYGTNLADAGNEENVLVYDPRDLGASPIVARRLSFFRQAYELDDAIELEARLADLATQPYGLERDAEIEALILRLADLDPAVALRIVSEIGLPLHFFEVLFVAWIDADESTALIALAAMEDRRLARAVALSLVPWLYEISPDAIERIAEGLNEANHDGLVADALVRLAETRPGEAMDQVFAIANWAGREEAAARIAKEWARRSPQQAMEHVFNNSLVEPRLRHRIHIAVLEEWAINDPDATLTYLNTVRGRSIFDLNYAGVDEVVRNLAVRRPDGLLALAERFPAVHRQDLRLAAFTSLFILNSDAAMERAAGMPPGPERRDFLEAIAMAYGQADPAAALDWAARLVDAPPRVMTSALNAAARQDLKFAIEFALDDPRRSALISNWLQRDDALSAMSAADVRGIADRLLNSAHVSPSVITGLMTRWAVVDPENAMRWLLAVSPTADRRIVHGMAEGFVRGDLSLSKEVITALPTDLRGDWITEIALVYLRYDSDEAISWINQFRYEHNFDDWVTTASARSLEMDTGVDPADIAALLATANQPDPTIATRVAARWAATAPQAAVNWSRSLSDERVRLDAVASAVRSWLDNDWDSALRWTLGGPTGAVRDSALTVILQRSVELGRTLDPRIPGAFSSDAARQMALEGTLRTLDPSGSGR